MPNSIDRSPSDQNSSGLDMAYLQALLRDQAQRRPLFENIAILGCGYVGSALADYWQTQGHFVTGTTTSRSRLAALDQILSQVVLLKGDDVEAVAALLQDQDTLVVSIAPTGDTAASAAAYEATYLTTARNLAKVLPQAPRVKQVIYISSCSIYGDRQGDWVDETTPVAPVEHHSQVLYEAEKILLQAAGSQKVCILRLGGIYGPGRELIGMFGGLAGTTLPGKGERLVNWIHRDDIVGAVEFVRNTELEGIYNLVDDSQLTIKAQIQRVCSAYGLPPVRWNPAQFSPQSKSLRISNQKLKAAGYQLTHPQLLV
jgi:nucleoside-diphosphate-sugar epimerase